MSDHCGDSSGVGGSGGDDDGDDGDDDGDDDDDGGGGSSLFLLRMPINSHAVNLERKMVLMIVVMVKKLQRKRKWI